MDLQGFYDPVNEKMFEPSLTGISYSFTDDGFYEEAYYRAISNRKRMFYAVTRILSNSSLSYRPQLSQGYNTMATWQIPEERKRLSQSATVRG